MKKIIIILMMVVLISLFELSFVEGKEYQYKDFVWGMSIERVVSTLLSRGFNGKGEFDSKQNMWKCYHMEEHFGLNCLVIFWFTPAESLKMVELRFEGDRFDICQRGLVKELGSPDRLAGAKASFWIAKQNKTGIVLIYSNDLTQIFYSSGIK